MHAHIQTFTLKSKELLYLGLGIELSDRGLAQQMQCPGFIFHWGEEELLMVYP